MPETQTPPATGEAGDGTTAAATQQQAGDATQTGAAGDSPKTFTQAELDAIVRDRVARAKPADYDDAKAALEELNKRREGEKTDLQRATEREAKAKEERDTARNELASARIAAAVQIEALKQGGDEELVALALAGDRTIEFKDGEVVGAKEAVEALLERKPNLKTGGVRQSAGEFGGKDGTTVNEQIKALEAKGDPESLREARSLKIAASLQAP